MAAVMALLLAFCLMPSAALEYFNEYKIMPGHTRFNHFSSPLPYTYVKPESIPSDFHWGNVSGKNLLTKSLNQHIPQYCGSCWAHGAMSAFADRIKIARQGNGIDINLAIQFILNCGTKVAGSCHGGSASGTYDFIEKNGFVPFDTCLQYAACSAESDEGSCKSDNYECSAMNTCRTCSTFAAAGGKCAAIDTFPNATVAEYGKVSGEDKMLAELFTRGPIACSINCEPLHEYTGGIFNDTSASKDTNHIVSITGFGVTSAGDKYWRVRNSWGEYWGEMGYFRIARGDDQLGLEGSCAWATPGQWTETNFACYEDGSNCQPGDLAKSVKYVDPSRNL